MKSSYNKQVVNIADYIFAKPGKNREEILSYFVVFFKKSRRTVERYYSEAKEYNAERLRDIEQGKKEMSAETELSLFQKGLFDREKYLLELQNDFIALGEIKPGAKYESLDEETGDAIGYGQASYSDGISAIAKRESIFKSIRDTMGWSAPKKIDHTSDGEKIKFNGFNFLPAYESTNESEQETKDGVQLS